MNHSVDTCPLTKFEGGLNLLHEEDDDAVIWLESACEINNMNGHCWRLLRKTSVSIADCGVCLLPFQEDCVLTWISLQCKLLASVWVFCGMWQCAALRLHWVVVASVDLMLASCYQWSAGFPSLPNLGPDLQNILRQSYDNAEVTTDLRLTSNLQNILRRMHGFS